MDYDLLFPGRFLKSAEFKGRDWTTTITGIRTEELEGEKGVKTKGIVSVAGTKKEWVLNRTNAECLKAMFGRETDAWIGKRVTLWPAPYTDSFTGEVGTAIRVRGSPDIAQDMSVEIRLPKKKPIKMVMKRTGQARPQQARPQQQSRPQQQAARPTQPQARQQPPPPVQEDPHADAEPPMPSEPPPPSDDYAPPVEESAPF